MISELYLLPILTATGFMFVAAFIVGYMFTISAPKARTHILGAGLLLLSTWSLIIILKLLDSNDVSETCCLFRYSFIVLPIFTLFVVKYNVLFLPKSLGKLWSNPQVRIPVLGIASTLTFFLVIEKVMRHAGSRIVHGTSLSSGLGDHTLDYLAVGFLLVTVLGLNLLIARALKRPANEDDSSSVIAISLSNIFLLLYIFSVYAAWWPLVPLTPNLALLWALLTVAPPIILTTRSCTLSRPSLYPHIVVLIIFALLFPQLIQSVTTYDFISHAFQFLLVLTLGVIFSKHLAKESHQALALDHVWSELTGANKELEKRVQLRTDSVMKMLQHVNRLIENLSIGIVEFDNNFKVTRINQAAEKILGVSRSKIVGVVIEPRMTTDSSLQSIARIAYPVLSTNAHHLESIDDNTQQHEMKLSHPITRDIKVISMPFTTKTDGTQEGVVKIVQDISREKEVDRNKSEFISIVAHKLRTPLSGVKWALRFVLDEDAGPVTEKQREYLTKSYETNEAMVRLVNDMLNVARVEKSSVNYELHDNNIVDSLKSVIEKLQPQASDKHISIELDTKTDNLLGVYDREKMEVVFEHLILNAITYTRSEGTVTVGAQVDHTGICVTVDDTGVGISPDQVDRLFTKFYRSEEAQHMYTDGSGLGLYISKQIVEAHRGTISLEPRERGGTRARVCLPR